ncbi:unnamed protein product [Didymodactylos carnosus]|uniref:Uncharacterized protein n=1 Tax=Didymodactylos carnosus TaxID=1234261 RepID=A0A814BSE6_9BILA|nr:unnamed protein product [Didymodactylos carnosus]CAF1049131.1 unnamed protein product [Didymodactylos carnosus]CAF3710486.1 unnamed protein product [Didymodactylos carnosus]CAF3816567.1 unnamed protein product [Didymodactylos carnosus]
MYQAQLNSQGEIHPNLWAWINYIKGSEESVMVRHEQEQCQQRSTRLRKARSVHNDAVLIAAKQNYMYDHIDLEDLQKLLRSLSHRYIKKLLIIYYTETAIHSKVEAMPENIVQISDMGNKNNDGIANLAYDGDTNDIRVSIINDGINTVTLTGDSKMHLNWRSKLKNLYKNYRWRMSHYFYIHLAIFICNTFTCGLIVWLIENRTVSYMDAWFLSSTCVFTCGLTTYDFAILRKESQIVLLMFTWISGITVSTIPAIIIKIYIAKREIRSRTNTATAAQKQQREPEREDDLPVKKFLSKHLNSALEAKIKSLPNADEIRITAYIILIVLILSICFTIYLITFISIGLYFKYKCSPEKLLQKNVTLNPFYASFVLTLTGFNQNGLSPW